MDSAGVGLLMNGYVSATNAGRQFLLAGVNERVGALLSMTRVDRVLPICTTTEDAEMAVRGAGQAGLRPAYTVRIGHGAV